MEPDAPSKKALIEPALLSGTASAVPRRGFATLRLQPLRYAPQAMLAACLAGIMLRLFPPGTSAFYPACPFYRWTGLLCPGCGGTRAVAALAHGHLAEAVRWNGLIVALLAAGAGWFAWACSVPYGSLPRPSHSGRQSLCPSSSWSEL